MRFNPRMKVETEETEGIQYTVKLSLKKRLMNLRAESEKAGVEFNATVEDALTEFADTGEAWLREHGKSRGKGQAKPPSDVILANGQA